MTRFSRSLRVRASDRPPPGGPARSVSLFPRNRPGSVRLRLDRDEMDLKDRPPDGRQSRNVPRVGSSAVVTTPDYQIDNPLALLDRAGAVRGVASALDRLWLERARESVLGHERRLRWPLPISALRSGSGRPKSHMPPSGGPPGLTGPAVRRQHPQPLSGHTAPAPGARSAPQPQTRIAAPFRIGSRAGSNPKVQDRTQRC
jgi:hypothetical protein